MPSPVLIILGQTAVGKSAVALEVAKELKGEIISADSMQVYRGMDIGTAKTPKAQRRKIPHHLIDIRNPDESWTVADFVEEVTRLVPEIQKRNRLPVIVGGTGLYLWSLLKGFSFPPLEADNELRKSLDEKSNEELYRELWAVDPVSAQKIHPNNKKRVIRALEVFKLTCMPLSEINKKNKERSTPYLNMGNAAFILFGLTLPREELYSRINQRVDEMIARGLVAEVEALLKKGYSKNLPAMEAIGYKEIIQYLDGVAPKKGDDGHHRLFWEETIASIKQHTRNFAKRQMTWFKRFQGVTWLENQNPEEVCRRVMQQIGLFP